MLSVLLTDALTHLINHEDGHAKLDQKARAAHWQTVRLALADASSARAQAQRAALARHAKAGDATHKGAAGRPISTWFAVALGTQWERRVLGTAAALELVTETLAAHKGNGAPPTPNSFAVTISRRGQWARHLTTDMGEHDLTVMRCAAPEPEIPDLQDATAKRRKR